MADRVKGIVLFTYLFFLLNFIISALFSKHLIGSSAPQQQQSTSPSDHKQRSRSPRENTKTRETSPTSQRGSHSFRGGRSNSSNRLQGSSSTSQLSTSYEQRQRSRSPRSSENNTKNRESSQTYYEQRQRSRSPIESFEPSDGDRSPRSPSPPDDQLASAEDDSNTDVVYPMTEERKSLLCFFFTFLLKEKPD